jgi:peroxiredoxin Q/BCP
MFWSKPELLPVGSPAPDFTVQDHLGHTVRRADLLGQRTILYWFPKADTPGCTKEACGFRDHFAELVGAGRVYGVSFDTPESNGRIEHAERVGNIGAHVEDSVARLKR